MHYVWRPTLDGIDAKGMHRSLHHKIYEPTGGGGGGGAPCTLVNHHPTLFGLCSKKGLLHSLLGYFGALGLQAFNVMPLTFSLPGGADGAVKLQAHVAWREFCRAHKAIARAARRSRSRRRRAREWCVANLWLLKPTHLNCGRGIEVIDNPQAVMRRLMRKPAGEAADAAEKGGTPEVHAWVLQKYIERPLLYRGRKFDLRIWCVVSDAFDVYVYEEGYVRQLRGLHDRARAPPTGSAARGVVGRSTDAAAAAANPNMNNMVHLTNYCHQRNSENLSAFEEGNTLFFDELQAYLGEVYTRECARRAAEARRRRERVRRRRRAPAKADAPPSARRGRRRRGRGRRGGRRRFRRFRRRAAARRPGRRRRLAADGRGRAAGRVDGGRRRVPRVAPHAAQRRRRAAPQLRAVRLRLHGRRGAQGLAARGELEPFLGTQSPRHGALVSRMIEDAHRIAVDTVFPRAAAAAAAAASRTASGCCTPSARRASSSST